MDSFPLKLPKNSFFINSGKKFSTPVPDSGDILRRHFDESLLMRISLFSPFLINYVYQKRTEGGASWEEAAIMAVECTSSSWTSWGVWKPWKEIQKKK